MSDNVNHPAHYQSKAGIEAVDVVEAFGLGFNLGNTVKYILRDGKKNAHPTEDLEKAAWYLTREIETRKKQHSAQVTIQGTVHLNTEPTQPTRPSAGSSDFDNGRGG